MNYSKKYSRKSSIAENESSSETEGDISIYDSPPTHKHSGRRSHGHCKNKWKRHHHYHESDSDNTSSEFTSKDESGSYDSSDQSSLSDSSGNFPFRNERTNDSNDDSLPEEEPNEESAPPLVHRQSKKSTPDQHNARQKKHKQGTSELRKSKSSTGSVKSHYYLNEEEKLRKSTVKQTNRAEELNKELKKLVSSDIKLTNGSSNVNPKNSERKIPSIAELTRDNTDVTGMGKKALAIHQAQQSQTTKTLEQLHKFLKVSMQEKEVTDPRGLKVSLLPHQKIGLGWLLLREKEVPAGGILADDMGLGKTLTVVSLILKDKENRQGKRGEDDNKGKKTLHKGHTLVVSPSSVMGQWYSEINAKVQSGLLSVCIHHGATKETNSQMLASYDVVLTTYTILRLENHGKKSGPLKEIDWNRIVLDEAHIVRNFKSQTAQAVCALSAKKRWALTGTPIHNKKEDYFSLLKFLQCRPFDDIVVWKKMVDNRGDLGMERLSLITKSLLLRRTKAEIQQAGGLKNLKPKEFIIIEVTLDPEELKVYNQISHFSSSLLAQYIQERAEKEDLVKHGLRMRRKGHSNPFADHPELGDLYNRMLTLKEGVQSHHILVLLLRLRQACCHLSLVTALIDKEELGDSFVEEDVEILDQMMNMSLTKKKSNSGRRVKTLSSDNPLFRRGRCSSKMRMAIDCITKILKSSNDKVIVVSQWTSVLEIFDDFLKERGIQTVSLNGTVPVKDRIGIIDNFNNNEQGPRILLLSLTAGGTGLNLVGANHLLLIDIHWNPQLEAQACDRIYRVGQTKEVHIYKLLCKNTIEERILKLQNEKTELAESIIAGATSSQSSKLTLQDLKLLFDVNL